jgi:3-phosphoshikimate 1-carboxyvinyltransferase
VASESTAFLIAPARRVAGQIRVPGDKSISHRALMLGAIADGTTHVDGLLRGADCLATWAALETLGVPIRAERNGYLQIEGQGMHGLKAPAAALDFGNSGTAMRLMAGVLSAQHFDSILTGDRSLRARPMERVAVPLRAMGANVVTDDGKAPIRIGGGAALHGIDYRLPVASAQVKSALLLAALYAQGRTTLHSPAPTRDHTERMLGAMGVAVERSADGRTVAVDGPAVLRATDIEVPGDFSSAAFFVVAACLGAADGLLIESVGVNPTRTGLLDVLVAMGGRIERRNERVTCGEPVADLYVEQSLLHGVDVPADAVPLMIDEFPILFVAAAAARGRTTVRGADELRHKESDRLAVMAEALRRLGRPVIEHADGLTVEGGPLGGGRIDSHGDHRVAMALAVAGLISDAPLHVLQTELVGTSFPGFAALANGCGLAIETVSAERD